MTYAQPPQGRNISQYNLINRELVGEGSFGKVYKAIWQTRDEDGDDIEEIVAIKIMKTATWSQALAERDRMAGLDHENVVGLRGIVQNDPCPWLVMEYVENGDLLSNIHEWERSGELDDDRMVRISWHVAKGMKYLHANGIVHGDLAARNILLGENDVAKIGDLGYYDSQNSYNYYNYHGGGMPCPVRWMAPENLPYRYTEQGLVGQPARKSYGGDVWAFGVVLFELWSGGEHPFDGHSDQKVCSLVLNKEKATHYYAVQMRNHLRGLMHSCWQYDSDKRPTFYTIVQHFEDKAGFEPEYYSDSNEACSDSSSSDDY
jgi:serine/threonine protein kinase